MTGAMIGALILGYATLSRLLELVIARRNEAALKQQGAQEFGAAHYPLIVLLHTSWLITMWLLFWGQPIVAFWLAIFIILQPLRYWVLGTLGRRWTTRVLMVPGETLVRRGPYRWIRHPNYWVVIGEIASLPLAFGLWRSALIFSVLNAIALSVRIRTEEAALLPVR